MKLITEIVDADSGDYPLIDENSQDFDVTLGSGEIYTFAIKLVFDDEEFTFRDCRTPQDIAEKITETILCQEYKIECVIAERPIP